MMNNCNCPTEAAPTTERNETIHQPRFTTHEDENGVTLQIALPAVAKDDLKLTLLESNLRIDAKRSDAVPQNWKTHRSTQTPERYRLDLRLTPRHDGSQAKATLDVGVLTLRVPIREEAKPRSIQVN
jgi:HSP20 family protein